MTRFLPILIITALASTASAQEPAPYVTDDGRSATPGGGQEAGHPFTFTLTTRHDLAAELSGAVATDWLSLRGAVSTDEMPSGTMAVWALAWPRYSFGVPNAEANGDTTISVGPRASALWEVNPGLWSWDVGLRVGAAMDAGSIWLDVAYRTSEWHGVLGVDLAHTIDWFALGGSVHLDFGGRGAALFVAWVGATGWGATLRLGVLLSSTDGLHERPVWWAGGYGVGAQTWTAFLSLEING